MLTLFYDTETTGLVRKELPFSDPSQPRLVQIGCKLVGDRREVLARFSAIVRPDGWSIEPEAEAHHHISAELAGRAGIPVQTILKAFMQIADKAHILVAHNHHNHDRLIMLSEIMWAGFDPSYWTGRVKDMRCTMEMAQPIMKLPTSFGEYKYPSLEEAHDFFLPETAPFTAQHEGESDTDACERIYWAIIDQREALIRAH